MMDNLEKSARILPKLNLLIWGYALIFPIVNFGGKIVDIPGPLIYVVIGLLYSYVFAFVVRAGIHKVTESQTRIFVAISFFACINCLIALDPTESAIKWAIWLATAYILVCFVNSLNYRDLVKFTSNLYYPIIAAALLASALNIKEFAMNTRTNNAVGLYAGMAFISAFLIEGKKKLIPLAIVALIIYGTSSRGAVLGVMLPVLIIIGYGRKSGASFYYILLVAVIGLIFYNSIESYVAEFFNRKATLQVGNASESLLHTTEVRQELVEQGVKLLADQWWGYGLGDAYKEKLALYFGREIHVHNGYLSTAIETGIHTALLFFSLIGISIKRYVANQFLPTNINLVIIAMLLYMFIRALGENYLILNSSNTITYVFIVLLIIPFSKKLIIAK